MDLFHTPSAITVNLECSGSSGATLAGPCPAVTYIPHSEDDDILVLSGLQVEPRDGMVDTVLASFCLFRLLYSLQ